MAVGRDSRGTVLVVDDDTAVGTVLVGLLRQAGYEASHASDGARGLATVLAGGVDIVITDLRMPGMDGMELLERLSRSAPDVPVVMITAHGTIDLAVEAMKGGAADFLVKPFEREGVLYTVEKAIASRRAAAAAPPPPAARPGPSPGLLGSSVAMRDCLSIVEKAATSPATVLLRGESGTGKELVARAIHAKSARASGPFAVIHCGALPDALLESELFGYEKGAFTGATAKKPGRIELAEGGTVFLDEIGDVSAAVQVKLLRLLQEREIQPLGATSARKADVRFIAATHRDLDEMVASGAFREDLFYRLAVLVLWLPPLRERGEDTRELAAHFVAEHAQAAGRARLAIDAGALDALARHPFPGNVRELANLAERLVLFADGAAITEADVARELGKSPGSGEQPRSSDEGVSLAARVATAERDAILDALARAGNNRTQAARLLGVSRRTLYNRMAELAID